MIATITKSQFRDAFHDTGRGEQFSYEGLGALFDYLEQFEDDTGEQMEFDVIALCCEFAEYSDFEELQSDYADVETMEELRDNTTVIEIDGSDGFIIQQY